jgi:SpoIID/LytB domain protein
LFSFDNNKENVRFNFTVYGYCHGVGMSQLGALAYAQRGWSYQSILYHYYPGTSLTRETPPATVTYGGKTYDTEDFVISVVQQEIGGYSRSGDEEALKAQTVAVYSFMKGRNYSLRSSDVAYSTLADSKLSSLVRASVKSVLGEYLTYGGSPISAQFYASSAGKTTSAQSVWGGSQYPYLAGGVESIETVSVSGSSISSEEFKELIEAYNRANPSKKITLSGSPSSWIEILAHDGARGNVGYVTNIRVGDKTMSGNTFRSIYNAYKNSGVAGLKSHCFSFTVS